MDALDVLATLEGDDPTPKPQQSPLDDILQARGILEAAQEAGWEEYTHKLDGQSCPGWRIPCYNRQGQVFARRWKNASHQAGDGKKYRWIPRKPNTDRALYYLLPDTLRAIKDAGGVCYLASGEPDVIAYRAAGIHNALCWFDGEGSVPTSLAADLGEFGVAELRYFPDCDQTGRESARKVRDALRDEWLVYTALDLKGEEKFDINKLWIAVNGDPEAFRQRLAEAPELELPAAEPEDRMDELFRPGDKAAQSTDGETWFAEYVALLKTDPRLSGEKREGSIMRFHCASPTHPDKNPSARISYDKDPELGIYVCSCGEHGWTAVGEWLGTRWEDFKREKREARRREQLARSANPLTSLPPLDTPENEREGGQERILGTEQYIDPRLLDFGVDYNSIPIERILFSSDDAAELYRDRMSGVYVVSNKPGPFPFKAFHHLGGVFRVASPGDLYCFAGLSGYGKTSFLDSLTDIGRQDGEHFLTIGPEIPWWKTADRLSQRWGQMSVTESLLQDLYHYEMQHGGEARFGEAASSQRINDSISQVEFAAANWPGKLFVLDQYGAHVNYLFAAVYKSVVHLRRHRNIRINRIILDYIQLMKMPPEFFGKMTYEDIIQSFRALCGVLGCIGYTTSQVRKSDTAAVVGGKSSAKNALDQDAGMGIRDFSFKGYATMRPGFKVDADGNKVPANFTIWNVTKNSEGRQHAEVELETIWSQMLFKDHEVGGVRANYHTEKRAGRAPLDRERDADADDEEITPRKLDL